MDRSPRVHTPAFKAKVALAAPKGDRTLGEIAAHSQVHVKPVQAWKKQMLEHAATVFSSGVKPATAKDSAAQHAELFEQIGRLKMELEWVKKSLALWSSDTVWGLPPDASPGTA